MSAEDVAMVRSGFEALEEGGIEALIPLIHPDFEMTTPASLAAEPDTYRGREGMRRYWAGFDDGMQGVRITAEGFEDLGDGRVLSRAVLGGRGRTTGIEVEQRVILVWEMQAGMARRCLIFASEEEARAAAGSGRTAAGS